MIENTGWQEASFKNFQTVDTDLKWFCLIPPDQFQFCFELKRIVRNSGISECLLKISGTEPTPASNPGYAAKCILILRILSDTCSHSAPEFFHAVVAVLFKQTATPYAARVLLWLGIPE
jgi:hypothetical protein